MSDVTRILAQIDSGEPAAAELLLPLVYDELRSLAAARLAHEKPGQTLQPTALVHEAYLRLVGGGDPQKWDSRSHFFGAAAEAMRRILVDAARRKGGAKRGGGQAVHSLEQIEIPVACRPEQLLALDEALGKLETQNAQAAQLVKLRFFAGFTLREAALALAVSPRKADQIWAYARACLLAEMGDNLAE
jgi:RNA polymerase sigma factor (TIGR02999 family)